MRLKSSIATAFVLALTSLVLHPKFLRMAAIGKAAGSLSGSQSSLVAESASTGTREVVGAVHAYEKEPTEDLAAIAWESFDALDARIARYRQQVDETAGGVRAEAELARIELQRLRDAQMTRFLNARSRWKDACAAFDALAASGNSNGVEDATAILIHGYRQSLETQAGATLRP